MRIRNEFWQDAGNAKGKKTLPRKSHQSSRCVRPRWSAATILYRSRHPRPNFSSYIWAAPCLTVRLGLLGTAAVPSVLIPPGVLGILHAP
ncbi:hypothetical protein B0T19DRAFT_475197 [Cercophora scortea]|uniref:Uncharacterized protein n=1 Tax=Cercophora scortea TaxID=314031 RepID=A0AAE0IM13_9PEZI|nr:hypothetical protein B0T19DRAFT_475197 [Cercophora scortea]